MKLVARSRPAPAPAAPPPEAAPAGSSVRYHHPKTGKLSTGTVRAKGPHGATVVDHVSGEAHKVAHGAYLADEHVGPPKPAPKDWEAEHPGLTRYPSPEVPPGKVKLHQEGSKRLSWKDPKTGEHHEAHDRATLRSQAGERFASLHEASSKLEELREAIAGDLRLGGSSRHAAVAARAALVERLGLSAEAAVGWAGEAKLPARLHHLLEGQPLAGRHRDGRGGRSSVSVEEIVEYLKGHGLEPDLMRQLLATRLWWELAQGASPHDARVAADAVGALIDVKADLVLSQLVDPTVIQAVAKGAKPLKGGKGTGQGDDTLSPRERAFIGALDKVAEMDPFQLGRQPEGVE
jgi:hypothetical protein